MNYASLLDCIIDLERNGHLLRITEEVDPYLEMAAIHRLIHAKNGPALFFEKVKGTRFPAVSNLFGTLERSRFVFRGALVSISKLIRLNIDPTLLIKNPLHFLNIPFTLKNTILKKTLRNPVLKNEVRIMDLPHIQAWPRDGGAFITLPQVYSEDPLHPGISRSNLGMYRIQLSGNRYLVNEEIGLHYQLHRGIGVHHTHAVEKNESLRVSIFIGGPPAHTFSAIMPLPENIPEVRFSGMLGGRRFRYSDWNEYKISADADFCIVGEIIPGETRPEGPFGDHLGYYSLTHEFPVMKVHKVFHRDKAVWPFTVVGRPPQEDTSFNLLIQEITGPLLPIKIPGLRELNAVDEAGVHPLLLAIGSERYIPYENREPRELLTIANAILGFGQLSLAKYLLITAAEDAPDLSTKNLPAFLVHFFERVDWTRDLHFQTQTTIDTLDYTGHGLNRGSKVVIAAAGIKKRQLTKQVPPNLKLPSSFSNPKLILPGVLVIQGPAYTVQENSQRLIGQIAWNKTDAFRGETALVVVVDDADFVSSSLSNFLWVTFTRSDPAKDIHGIESFSRDKHWGCVGPLVIDARKKPHHAPELYEDPEILKQIERLGRRGGSLHGWL